MDTSERSLARKLSARGLTYQSIVDEARFNTATESLRDTDVPIGEIAGSVGFDDPAHFTRMFRCIGGLSPRAFRTAVRAERGRLKLQALDACRILPAPIVACPRASPITGPRTNDVLAKAAG